MCGATCSVEGQEGDSRTMCQGILVCMDHSASTTLTQG